MISTSTPSTLSQYLMMMIIITIIIITLDTIASLRINYQEAVMMRGSFIPRVLFLSGNRKTITLGQICSYPFRPCLQSSEIPQRLSKTWNCSVPHWPHFERHFRCNMRQECASSKDEVECPYSLCAHGGVSFFGHCYFIIRLKSWRTWDAARKECRKFGASLASLTSPREWSDVMRWLHLGVPWLIGYTEKTLSIGLQSAPPSLPNM